MMLLIFSSDKSRISLIDSHKDVIVKLKFIGTFQEGEILKTSKLRVITYSHLRLIQGDGRDIHS